VDAAGRGQRPGTVYFIEPDLVRLQEQAPASPDAHTLDVSSVLQMAQSLGQVTGQFYLVGCEPAVLESEDGRIGLSAAAQAAVPQAVMLIEALIGNSVSHETKTSAGLVPG
jgi:hydrogenase maturation protease